MLFRLFKAILKRPFFRGQDRLFYLLFTRKKLNQGSMVVKPIEGNFQINCDTETWIGAKIVYTGDYEPTLKKTFKEVIKKGDTILDIGANIGFHTLYFAELTGETGKVIAFEPVPTNFAKLTYNVGLNTFKNIELRNIALGNKAENISIKADINSNNPGAYHLFDREGDVLINCQIGDELIKDQPIDFIKIDVEGYESFVIDGLTQTIKKNKPIIVFEYDSSYHLRTGLPHDFIFNLLVPFNYTFFAISIRGLIEIENVSEIKSSNILAIVKKHA